MKKENEQVLEELISKHNLRLSSNKKSAGRFKRRNIDINRTLAHLGGVKTVVLSLNTAAELVADPRQADALAQLRDELIVAYYGQETWNLLEFTLASSLRIQLAKQNIPPYPQNA